MLLLYTKKRRESYRFFCRKRRGRAAPLQGKTTERREEGVAVKTEETERRRSWCEM
jgi:hypothetical protein